jgi:putative transposase
MRYIELNPVRAGMVSHPSDYPWSSYHHNALGQPNNLVTTYLEYRRLGKTDEERQAAYRQLFKHHIPEHSVSEIREATNKAWVLGNDRFKRRIQNQLERRVEPEAKGGDRKSEKFRINRGKRGRYPGRYALFLDSSLCDEEQESNIASVNITVTR